MADKFTKLMQKMRKPIGRDKYEALTGKSLDKADQSLEFKRRLEEAETEEQRKKIRQAAHLQGITLE